MQTKEDWNMKVVGFVGSPRKGASTDTLVEQVLAEAADAGGSPNPSCL